MTEPVTLVEMLAQAILNRMPAACHVEVESLEAAHDVLHLLQTKGRVLWWCPATQLGLAVNDRCQRSRHRRGLFVETEL